MTAEHFTARLAADLRALWAAITDLTGRVERLEQQPPTTTED